jgi:phosphatidylglycerophosphatase A
MTPTKTPAAGAGGATSRRTPGWIIATCAGLGLVQPGPGTWTAAATTLLWLALAFLLHIPPHPLFLFTLLLALLTTVAGIPASTHVARASGIHDPGFVVIDEAAGQFTALLAACLPFASWRFALVAFGLFRAFDILKPWPVSALERLPEGWGIMMDDVAAGICALIFTALLRHFLSGHVFAFAPLF